MQTQAPTEAERRADEDELVDDDGLPTGRTIDANAVVSYNIRAIRERRGWTQEQVAVRLGRITGHQLPQASISAMERGVDGSRRRRFDAHELYLFSVVFDVPIVYFFMPPPQHGEMVRLADTNHVAVHLYAQLLGHSRQLSDVDERLRGVDIVDPEKTPGVLTSLFGRTSGAKTWAGHYRQWRQDCLHQLAGDPAGLLRQVAGFLECLSREVAADGREACLARLEDGGSV